MSRFENRRWVIFPITELSKVDFSTVKETESGLRKSVDNSKTFINGMVRLHPLYLIFLIQKVHIRIVRY